MTDKIVTVDKSLLGKCIGILSDVDMMIKSLTNEKIVQTFHVYEPHEFTHANDEMGWYVKHGGQVKTVLYPSDGYAQIEARLKEAADFSKDTGVPVMMQEFGCMSINDIGEAVKYYEDILSLAEKYNISWCNYTYDSDTFSYVALSNPCRRFNGTYVKVGTGRYVAKELRAVFKKYMK